MINNLLRPDLFLNEIVYLGFTSIILTNLLTFLFYNAFKLKWPDLYFSVNDMAVFFISVSFKRYIAFRFLPVFIIFTLILGIFAKGLNINTVTIFGLLSMTIYASLTDGRAIFDLLTRSKRIKIYFNFSFQVLLHVITFVSLLGVGLVAGLAANSTLVAKITPTMQGLVDNIWSAVLAVIIIEYLRILYSEKGVSVEEMFKRSLNSIDPKILNHIDKMCHEKGANLILVKAISIVENIQRPKWIRKFEFIPATLHLTGTYGIMQVRANKRISDIDSVTIAVDKYFSNTENLRDNESLSSKIREYNPSKEYEDLVMRAMYYLDPNSAEYPG